MIKINDSYINNIIIDSNISFNKAMEIYSLPFNDLLYLSSSIHRKFHNHNEIEISQLLSIKTGSCPENCSYCPQSAHYNTGLEKESLMSIDNILEVAKRAQKNKVKRFCMGAAWRNVNDRDLEYICKLITEVKKLKLETCLTLGMLTLDQAIKMKNAGLDYYNHNIDTSEEYYDKIITTRTFQDRIKTLENVIEAGINVCCGGIMGMGETIEDRIKMLLILKKLKTPPKSIPINKLIKIKNTPLENEKDLDNFELVRIIALTRILFPKSYVRLSAGRENMSEETQSLCFFAGVNSVFYGNKLLTANNQSESKDQKLFNKLQINSNNL